MTTRHMGEWRYSSTILDLGTRWMWVVSCTDRVLYPRETAPGTQWIGGLSGPRTGFYGMERRKLNSLRCEKWLFVHWYKLSEHSVFPSPLSFCGYSTSHYRESSFTNSIPLVQITNNYFKIFQLQNYSHDALRPAVTSKYIHSIWFEVLTSVTMKITLFRDVMLCSLVDVYSHHHHGPTPSVRITSLPTLGLVWN
jgi:hypothetical protein